MTSSTLVCLHGFLGSPAEMEDIFPQNYDALNIDIVALDLVSIFKQARPQSLGDMAFAIRHECEQRDLEAPLLYGYSMGGRIALQAICLFPYYFSGLIVESAHPGFVLAEHRIDAMNKAQASHDRFSSMTQETFLKTWYELPLFCKSHTLISPKNYATKRSLELTLMLDLRLNMHVYKQPNLRQPLKNWRRPWLYIAGEYDSDYVTLGSSITDAHPTGRFHCVQNADHNCHLCDPAAVRELILNYIAELPPL